MGKIQKTLDTTLTSKGKRYRLLVLVSAFTPGQVESASSPANNMYLIEEDTLEFD